MPSIAIVGCNKVKKKLRTHVSVWCSIIWRNWPLHKDILIFCTFSLAKNEPHQTSMCIELKRRQKPSHKISKCISYRKINYRGISLSIMQTKTYELPCALARHRPKVHVRWKVQRQQRRKNRIRKKRKRKYALIATCAWLYNCHIHRRLFRCHRRTVTYMMCDIIFDTCACIPDNVRRRHIV